MAAAASSRQTRARTTQSFRWVPCVASIRRLGCIDHPPHPPTHTAPGLRQGWRLARRQQRFASDAAKPERAADGGDVQRGDLGVRKQGVRGMVGVCGVLECVGVGGWGVRVCVLYVCLVCSDECVYACVCGACPLAGGLTCWRAFCTRQNPSCSACYDDWPHHQPLSIRPAPPPTSNRHFQGAEDLLHRMSASNIQPTTATYNSLIDAYASKGCVYVLKLFNLIG